MKTLEELYENPPKDLDAIADLARWSVNYSEEQGTPWQLFLDLTGYSESEYGERLFPINKIASSLGFMELDMLADALKQYAANPGTATDFVSKLLARESEEV